MKVKIITKLEEYISEELDKVVDNKNIDREKKMEAFNVYYNIYQFLKDYDKNIEILKRNQVDKRFEER